jgi:hypothetical protein
MTDISPDHLHLLTLARAAIKASGDAQRQTLSQGQLGHRLLLDRLGA